MTDHRNSVAPEQGNTPKSRSVEYRAWQNMQARCTNPLHKDFPNYGRRGISICPEWNSFERFFRDMGYRPSPSHSIDRINSDGNYELTNCQWATRIEQNNNRSNVRKLPFRGKFLSIGAAIRLTGCTLGHGTVHSRIQRGWSLEDAISTASLSSKENADV